MSRDWKTGDVRLATVNGEQMLVLRGRGIFEGNWYTQGPVAGSRLSVSDDWLLDDRPLVVIDAEDGEAVERLAHLVWKFWETQPNSMQGAVLLALRELANPTVKPEEPTDPAARVWANSSVWAKCGPWWVTPAINEVPREWDYLVEFDDVEVQS